MTEPRRRTLRRPAAAALGLVALAMSGCTTISVPGGPDLMGQTAAPPRQPTADRPEPDARGVISYPTYQVAVARDGDTVTTIAQRLGLDPASLASVNGLPPNAPLNAGEIVLLNQRVATSATAAPAAAGGATAGLASGAGGAVDVATLAGSALDRAEGQPAAAGTTATAAATPAPTSSPAPKAAPAKPAAPAKVATGTEPVRHVVKRGETAYSIARMYNVSVRSLADWNGLDAKMTVREGQTLLIPVATGPAPKTAAVTAPGAGSPTPEPPSAAEPQPADEAPKAQAAAPSSGGGSAPAAAAAPAKTETAPVVAAPQTKASDTARLAQPVAGKIVSPYKPGSNEGVDFGAPAGAPVKAADAGTVAAITQDTEQVPIIVIRHANGLLTVYANVDDITVEKGTTVARGQTIATVGGGNPSYLHFEVREGFDSVDPVDYLAN